MLSSRHRHACPEPTQNWSVYSESWIEETLTCLLLNYWLWMHSGRKGIIVFSFVSIAEFALLQQKLQTHVHIDGLDNSMAHKTGYWRCGSVAKRLAALPDDLVLSQNPYNNTQLCVASFPGDRMLSLASTGTRQHVAHTDTGKHSYA